MIYDILKAHKYPSLNALNIHYFRIISPSHGFVSLNHPLTLRKRYAQNYLDATLLFKDKSVVLLLNENAREKHGKNLKKTLPI